MTLSILIPVYNYCCAPLVASLHTMAIKLGISFEILLADDGSTNSETKMQNRKVAGMAHIRYVEHAQNHGRAWIRNWLVAKASGEMLLFVDSDAVVNTPTFLQQYQPYMHSQAVVCGGIVHPEILPSKEVSLRYNYEKALEPKFTAAKRSQNPYHCLRTFNLMIPRQIALDHPFDESITRYGYEDTLLGERLKEADIEIVHIDNPLTNGDIETNVSFLAKTEESMHTLLSLREKMQTQSRLLIQYHKLERWHLINPIAIAFRILQPLLKYLLVGYCPRATLLQVYKLGYFSSIARIENQDKK